MHSSTESQLLKNAFQEFLKASDSLSTHYVALEERISRLNRELFEKNKELERSRESFHNILNSLPVGVVVREGNCPVFSNREAQKCGWVEISEKLSQDQTRMGEVRNGNGIFRWKRNVLSDESGEKEVIVFEDMTEVHKLTERSERDERLRAMGEMAARIAHEIKNPLGSMQLYLSMVLRGKVGDKERNHVNSVVYGINTIDRIINNLLSYTRPKTVVMREACLSALVKETLDFMSISIGSRDIQISFDSHYDHATWFDPDLIKLALMNFISNGMEAIVDKGTIGIIIRNDGDYVVAVFSDSGRGMSDETRRDIFNPFFTTKEKGVGLGLFIAHNVIKAHDGFIEVESIEGKGSVFSIYLPKEKSTGKDRICETYW
jgi:two-component system sensor histidine kinase FlrB